VPPEFRIETVPFDHPDAAALRAAQRAELAVRYGTPDSEPGPAPTAADTAVFLLARDEQGRALGCGALRELGGGLGEVKRMYVAPERRRSGVAAAVLAALEAEALTRGWTHLRLETERCNRTPSRSTSGTATGGSRTTARTWVSRCRSATSVRLPGAPPSRAGELPGPRGSGRQER
jgi:GNAT superfamily N-acetyltransferase